MANSYFLDAVQVTVSGAPGTGAITLGSAVPGFQSFSSAGVANGQAVAYYVIDVGGVFEYGRGTYSSSGPSLTRSTILSNGGTPVSLTSAAIVVATILAEDMRPTLRVAVADANHTVAIGEAVIAYTSITAARGVTLPAANTYQPGQQLLVVDESGSCSSVNTITLNRAGSDTINGSTTAIIASAYGYVCIESNGSGQWTIVDSINALLALNNSWSGTNSFSNTVSLLGSVSTLALILANAAENVTVSATAATGTVNFYLGSQALLYYTTAATANWTLNVAFSSSVALNTALANNQAVTLVFMVTQGSTPYYMSTFEIDGVAVTPKWQGGIAPTGGDASSIDVYTFSIVKTGSATYTVLAALTQFA